MLYQELAAHDAPRLVLAFVAIHHAASTLLAAGTEEQRRRHLPAILDGEIWVPGVLRARGRVRPCQPAHLGTPRWRLATSSTARSYGPAARKHADWCLLLARTDPDAPKRKGISYFLLDMRTPGIEVRPIRHAIGESHFCEIFLDDVSIPAANSSGAENAGWQVAQATLGAERGMTMLELAERLGNAGFRWLVRGDVPPRRPVVADRLAQLETEITGLRALCRKWWRTRGRNRRPGRRVDREAVLQRAAAATDRLRRRDRRARRATAAGQADVERLGVGCLGAGFHRLVGVDDPGRVERDPAHHHRRTRPRAAARTERGLMAHEFAEFHEELRSVAGDLLAKERTVEWPVLADAGWTGLEVADHLGGSGATFGEVAIVWRRSGGPPAQLTISAAAFSRLVS